MDDIIVNIETLLCEFQVKFKELEDIVYITNQQFNRLKVEYVKSVPIAKGSVMSMKDFVSYMSTLEDVENEETSQNISELPYDDNDTPEPIKPDIVEEPLFNQNNIETTKPRPKRKSARKSHTFSKHHVIHEEVESDEIFGSELDESSYSQTSKTEPWKIKSQPTKAETATKTENSKPDAQTFTQPSENLSSKLSNKKPTNLDIVKVRIKPDLKTLPVKQHPEPAILASPAPSPMTPTEEKIPKMDNEKNQLDKINNNPSIPENKTYPAETMNQNQLKNKLQCKEGKLPAPKTVILSPSPLPRNSKIPTPTPRNLTRTVCSQPNAELLKCKKCGRVRCVNPAHRHNNTRSKVKTSPREWKSDID